MKAKASGGGGGWFSWILGSSSTAIVREDTSGVMQRVQEEMTPEEKQKLYAVLDYTDGMGRNSYPPEYVSTVVNFSLGGLTLILANSEVKYVKPNFKYFST